MVDNPEYKGKWEYTDDPGTRLQGRTMNLPGMQVVARTLVLELWQVTAGTLDDILVTDSLRRPKRTQKKLFAEGEKAMYDQIQEDNKTKWYARMV
jgi:hypothetical protein